jgi:hypothetical protein
VRTGILYFSVSLKGFSSFLLNPSGAFYFSKLFDKTAK